MSQNFNPEIVEFIDRLAEVGSNYRIPEMEPLYTEDVVLLALTPVGVQRISRSQMIADFRARREAGEKPLSTEKKILHIEENGEEATALLYRRMDPEAAASFYELRLKKREGSWKVAGETISPWPDFVTSQGDVLPASR